MPYLGQFSCALKLCTSQVCLGRGRIQGLGRLGRGGCMDTSDPCLIYVNWPFVFFYFLPFIPRWGRRHPTKGWKSDHLHSSAGDKFTEICSTISLGRRLKDNSHFHSFSNVNTFRWVGWELHTICRDVASKENSHSPTTLSHTGRDWPRFHFFVGKLKNIGNLEWKLNLKSCCPHQS